MFVASLLEPYSNPEGPCCNFLRYQQSMGRHSYNPGRNDILVMGLWGTRVVLFSAQVTGLIRTIPRSTSYQYFCGIGSIALIFMMIYFLASMGLINGFNVVMVMHSYLKAI